MGLAKQMPTATLANLSGFMGAYRAGLLEDIRQELLATEQLLSTSDKLTADSPEGKKLMRSKIELRNRNARAGAIRRAFLTRSLEWTERASELPPFSGSRPGSTRTACGRLMMIAAIYARKSTE